LGQKKTKIFLKKGLDSQISDLPRADQQAGPIGPLNRKLCDINRLQL
jgi:hypothetical protein